MKWHYKDLNDTFAICGEPVWLFWTARIEKVTCKKCKAKLAKLVKKGLDFI